MTNRSRILLVFFLHGMVVSGFLTRIPEIQFANAISEASYGLALAGIPLGVLLGSFFAGSLIETLGARRTILIAHPFIAFSMLPTAFTVGPGDLFAVMFLFGLAMAASNITMNVEADRVEVATKRKIMNKCHGSWGVGSLLWALMASYSVRLGVPVLLFWTVTFVIVALATLIFVWPYQPSPARPTAHGHIRRVAMPNRGTLLVVAFALTALWYEGVLRSWGVIFLRDTFGAAPAMAALALPALLVMNTAVRLVADPLVERFGAVTVGRVLSGVALVGMALLVSTGSTLLALAAIALVGLGTSTGWPQAASAAAGWGDRPASENVAAFSLLQTVVAFVAPAATGLLAETFDLRTALMFFLPVPLISIYFARYLGPVKRPG